MQMYLVYGILLSQTFAISSGDDASNGDGATPDGENGGCCECHGSAEAEEVVRESTIRR